MRKKREYGSEVSTPIQILIKCQNNDDFLKKIDFMRNVPQIFEHKSRVRFLNSRSISDGNLADGLLSARHMGSMNERYFIELAVTNSFKLIVIFLLG